MVPLSVCSGGSGTISKVCLSNEDRKEELQGLNNAGHGVAMNNATPSNEPSTSALGPPPTTTNNLNLVNDVQRLQQQLQDIKEQVKSTTKHFFYFMNLKTFILF